MGWNMEDLNAKLTTLWALSFHGEIYRGGEPTGVKLEYGRSDGEAWLTLRGVQLEVPQQLRIRARLLWGRDNDSEEWKLIDDEPMLCTFLLLDPRIYSNHLSNDEWEQNDDGTCLMKAQYDVTELTFPRSIDPLLPREAIDWMMRWQRHVRWISFRLDKDHFPQEVSQEDLPPHHDPNDALNPDFTVTVKISSPTR